MLGPGRRLRGWDGGGGGGPVVEVWTWRYDHEGLDSSRPPIPSSCCVTAAGRSWGLLW